MATHVHVVLSEDVKNLGKTGDVVRVRPGHARNYLIPRGLALPASAANLARIEELKRSAAARAAGELAAAQALAARLAEVTARIPRQVGEGERLYGSVTARDIWAAFAEQGVELDRRKIDLGEPIRALGTFEVPIRLHREVTATLKVQVVARN